MTKKITETPLVSQMSDTDQVIGVFGGATGRMNVQDFRSHLNDDDNQVLNDIAFYIDVNSASSLGSTRVDTGGNAHMRAMWEAEWKDVLMDKNGNYCELNPSDCRYTAEGTPVVDLSTNEVVSAYAHCDFMKIIPKTYGRIQTVQVGANTRQRLWLSLVPLPNGYVIPQQVVGKFKSSNVSSVMRSLPNKVPDNNRSINDFWTLAQARSKNHGLANLDFRNSLLFYMMAKYGWRDSQNCKTSDSTLVWGVGLDGTESTGSDKFTCQRYITTGKTLSLGKYDGKVATTDADSTTVHCVNVAGFENPWGQYREMVQGLCSVGTDVYHWRSNVMPTGTPTAASFTNIDHTVLTRPTSQVWAMNIIESEEGQGCYMIPKQSINNVSYGDYFSYNADGQLWLWGGDSDHESNCGLAGSASHNVWSNSNSRISARLAFYGEVTKVSATRLAELAS